METAINSGILQTPADPSEVTGDCPTGNCTFSYQTMGVCSRLDDVSPTIITDCHHENIGAATQCFYSVADLRDRPPWREDNMTTVGLEMTLWVAASKADESGIVDPNPSSLGVFYTLYLPDTKVYPYSGSRPNFTGHMVALKGSFNLCVISYQTTVQNGVTKTEEKSRVVDLTWEQDEQKIDDSERQILSTTTGGKQYWITQDSMNAFKKYFSYEVFHGHSQTGLGGEMGSTDAAAALAGLLVNKADGQGAVSRMLENAAVGMTNA